MKTSLAEATHSPGIISVPGDTGAGNPAPLPHTIIAVPDVHSYMEQQQLSEAFVIYLDSLEEAQRFLEELNASREQG